MKKDKNNDLKSKNTKDKFFGFNQLQKRQILLISMMLLVVAGVCFGFTYAWIKMNEKEMVKEQTFLASLEVNVEETGSSSLVMEEPYPMNELGGLSTEPYKFTLSNTGVNSINYSLNLIEDTRSLSECTEKSNGVACKTISVDNMRYSIKKDGRILSTGLLADSKGVIDMGIIRAHAENEDKSSVIYELKLWVDINTKEDVAGSKFYGKIDIRVQSGK